MRGRGLRSKGLRDPSDQGLSTTCENRRHEVLIEAAVQPAHVPEPLADVPVQVQDAAVAVRVLKDCSVKEDDPRIAVDLLLPRLGNQALIGPERVEHISIQPDVPRRLQAGEVLLARDVGLALQHRDVLDLVHVQLR